MTEASPATQVDADTTRTLADNTTGARDMANENTIVVQVPEPEPVQPVKRGRGRPRKHPITVFLQEDEQYQFEASRQVEVVGLLEKGVFEVAHNVPSDVRIFKARFVDEVKNKDTNKAYEKSRLVVQAYNDDEKSLVLTQSPTIQRVSQRIILCIAPMAMNTDVGLYLG
jgi:hypothetical protein